MSKPTIEEILAPKPEARPRIYTYSIDGRTETELFPNCCFSCPEAGPPPANVSGVIPVAVQPSQSKFNMNAQSTYRPPYEKIKSDVRLGGKA